jgi:hypothetical protein
MKDIRVSTRALILCLGLSFAACSSAPSNEEAKQAITEYLQKNKAWSISAKDQNDKESKSSDLKLGAELKVESVEISQIGKLNEQEKFWPVRARIKGTYQASFLMIKADKQVDEEADFRLYKNDDGIWRATAKEKQ